MISRNARPLMTLRDERHPSRGRAMQVIGIALLSLATVALFVLRLTPIDDEVVTWMATPVLLTTFVAGAFVFYRGKQYAARARAQAPSQDTRPPVVYLRPFTSDASFASQVFTAVLFPKLFSGYASDEEQLVEAVAPIGPLVAIGQPGERLPKPGAVRAYASDSEWKHVVDHWLSIARLVVLQPGTSEGVRWEMERAVTTVSPDRFVLLIRLKAVDYDAVSQSLRNRFGIALPPVDEVRRWRFVSGFFEFDDGWRGRFLPLKAPFWRAGPYKPMRTLFHYALEPVFDRLDISWRPAPVSVGKVVGLGLPALLFAAFGAFIVAALLNPRDTYQPVYEPARTEPATTEPAATKPEPTAEISAPDADWAPWNVVGLRISVPGFLDPDTQQVPMNAPAAAQQAIEQFEGFQVTSGSALVTATRITYRPEVQLSLQGAVQGSIAGATAQPGVADVRTSSAPAIVSGHPAIRAVILFTGDGQRLRMESVTFIAGQTMWQVNAVVPDSDQAVETLERILGSVTRE